jgi:hypothetical protein
MLGFWASAMKGFDASRTFGFVFKKAIDFAKGPIMNDDRVTMIGNVQDQVLTHDGQTDEAEIRTGVDPRWSADIHAGKTGAAVSP